MTNSAMMPNAARIQWYDEKNEYHSETFTDFVAASVLFRKLRDKGMRVGQKPLYNYQSDSE